MDVRDLILTALKPGSPLNPNGKIFRSMEVLVAFTGLEAGEVQELLLGDLAQQVHIKPSIKKGWMVRLRPVEVQAQAAALAAAVIGGPVEAVIQAELPLAYTDQELLEKSQAFAAGMLAAADEDVAGLGEDLDALEDEEDNEHSLEEELDDE